MTASHLVTWLNATLNREVNLHDLENAGRKVVATLKLLFLRFETLFEELILLFKQTLC